MSVSRLLVVNVSQTEALLSKTVLHPYYKFLVCVYKVTKEAAKGCHGCEHCDVMPCLHSGV